MKYLQIFQHVSIHFTIILPIFCCLKNWNLLKEYVKICCYKCIIYACDDIIKQKIKVNLCIWLSFWLKVLMHLKNVDKHQCISTNFKVFQMSTNINTAYPVSTQIPVWDFKGQFRLVLEQLLLTYSASFTLFTTF